MNPTTTRPAVDPKTFKTFAEFYPFYMGGWVMYKDLWTGRSTL